MEEDETMDLGEWAQTMPLNLPVYRNPFPSDDDYTPLPVIMSREGQVADYADYNHINQEIDKLRIALYKTYEHLRVVEAKLSKAKLAWEREYNRQYLSVNAKTEAMRKAAASIMTEEYENKVIVREIVYKDLVRRTKAMASDLEALKTLAYNLRKETDSVQ